MGDTLRPCQCGATCWLEHREDDGEPCWGEVRVVAEEWDDDGNWWWIHECEGHLNTWDECEAYRPAPKGIDT